MTKIVNKPLEYQRDLWPLFSFAGGPTQLPRTIIKEAAKSFLRYKETGLSIMELSSKTKEFHEIYESATSDLRSLYNLPSDFKIYFSHGGATLIFEALVYNLKEDKPKVSFADTGHWSEKAIKEARFISEVHVPIKTQIDEFGKSYIPDLDQWDNDVNSAFLHYCDNETADGLEFQYTPKYQDQTLITDVSSNFLTRQVDWSKVDILYSHGQKNVGIAGSSITIIKEKLLKPDKMKITPYMCDFQKLAETNGALNALPVHPIYINSLMFKYIRETGGVEFWNNHIQNRSEKIYAAIDNSHGFYIGNVVKSQRSRISVTFNLRNEVKLQEKFLSEAADEHIIEIKGHRSRGGCRICLYVPVSDLGIDILADFMMRFAIKYQDVI